MKKLVIIIGSNKPKEKSKTAELAAEFIDALKVRYQQFETEYIMLGEKNIEVCRGCLTCTKVGTCPIQDDVKEIEKKMEDADLIIFGSPVHISHVSAVYKNFLDRIFLSMHIFKYLGKPCINVITTNGSGEQETEKYMNQISNLLGTIRIGNLIRLNSVTFEQRKLEKLAEKTAVILKNPANLKAGMINSLFFSSMKDIIKKNPQYFIYESKYWMEQGWMHKSYKQIMQEKYKF